MKHKIITLKVFSSKRTYRLIEIRANKSLYDLAEAIINAFDFQFDHAFGFYNNIEDMYGSDEIYKLFADDPDTGQKEGTKGVKTVEIHQAFKPQKKMLFLFDYGDEWFFLVECIGYSNPTPKICYPRVIEKVGKSPRQY